MWGSIFASLAKMPLPFGEISKNPFRKRGSLSCFPLASFLCRSKGKCVKRASRTKAKKLPPFKNKHKTQLPLANPPPLCYTTHNTNAGYGSHDPFNKEAGENPARARRRNGYFRTPSPRSIRKPTVGQKPLADNCREGGRCRPKSEDLPHARKPWRAPNRASVR